MLFGLMLDAVVDFRTGVVADAMSGSGEHGKALLLGQETRAASGVPRV